MNASQSPTLTLGNRKQLFLDDYVIERSEGLRRVVNQFEKHPANPVLKSELPWEQQRIGEYVLLYDEEEKLFKCWYPGCAVFYDRETTAADQTSGYAESPDGVCWEKRQLGRDATIAGGQNRHLLLRDPRATDPAKRYKALARGPEGYYHTCYSPDGLEWSGGADLGALGRTGRAPALRAQRGQAVRLRLGRLPTERRNRSALVL